MLSVNDSSNLSMRAFIAVKRHMLQLNSLSCQEVSSMLCNAEMQTHGHIAGSIVSIQAI